MSECCIRWITGSIIWSTSDFLREQLYRRRKQRKCLTDSIFQALDESTMYCTGASNAVRFASNTHKRTLYFRAFQISTTAYFIYISRHAVTMKAAESAKIVATSFIFSIFNIIGSSSYFLCEQLLQILSLAEFPASRFCSSFELSCKFSFSLSPCLIEQSRRLQPVKLVLKSC